MKKILALLLACTLMLSVAFTMASCDLLEDLIGTQDSTDDSDNTGNDDNTGNNDNTGNDDNTGNESDEENKDPNKFISASLEKVEEISGTLYHGLGTTVAINSAKNQYLIKDIVTGKTTSDVFVKVSVIDNYFVVTEKFPEDVNDFDAINSTGVISANVEKTVPCEYALIRKIADGYALAYKATEITENES